MIDYNYINIANEYYLNKGYKRIETPWLVSEYIANLTKPEDSKEDYVIKRNDKHLIASGEQGFLYLILKEFLPKGKYQTTTPCFRNESFDFTHSKYFMKTELINFECTSLNCLKILIEDSKRFFLKYFDEKHIKVEKLEDDSYDINLVFNDKVYELGSYGIRKHEFVEYIYGTGIAEPRFSKVLNLYINER